MFEWKEGIESAQLRRHLERYWLASEKNIIKEGEGETGTWNNVIEINSVDEWKAILNRHSPVFLAFVPPLPLIDPQTARTSSETIGGGIRGQKTIKLLRSLAQSRPISSVFAWTSDASLLGLVQTTDSSVPPEDPLNPFIPSVAIKKRAYFQDQDQDQDRELDGVIVLYRTTGEPLEWRVNRPSEMLIATDEIVELKLGEDDHEKTIIAIWKWFEINTIPWVLETNKDNFNDFVQTGRPLMILWSDHSSKRSHQQLVSNLEEVCWALGSTPILCLQTIANSPATKVQMLAFGIDVNSPSGVCFFFFFFSCLFFRLMQDVDSGLMFPVVGWKTEIARAEHPRSVCRDGTMDLCL